MEKKEKAKTHLGARLLELYKRLYTAFGAQGWWPGETPFEVSLGAILTQNTNWQNVARVIEVLKGRGCLDPGTLAAMPQAELAGLLKPVGYYNLKAARVKNFLAFLAQHGGNSMERLAQEPLDRLRPALLAVKGVGPETADSILLYALNKPTFVIDAYTFRVLNRHGLAGENLTYEELQNLFLDHLPPEVPLFQEFHALFVRVGKDFCRPQPRCGGCPLEGWP